MSRLGEPSNSYLVGSGICLHHAAAAARCRRHDGQGGVIVVLVCPSQPSWGRNGLGNARPTGAVYLDRADP